MCFTSTCYWLQISRFQLLSWISISSSWAWLWFARFHGPDRCDTNRLQKKRRVGEMHSAETMSLSPLHITHLLHGTTSIIFIQLNVQHVHDQGAYTCVRQSVTKPILHSNLQCFRRCVIRRHFSIQPPTVVLVKHVSKVLICFVFVCCSIGRAMIPSVHTTKTPHLEHKLKMMLVGPMQWPLVEVRRHPNNRDLYHANFTAVYVLNRQVMIMLIGKVILTLPITTPTTSNINRNRWNDLTSNGFARGHFTMPPAGRT